MDLDALREHPAFANLGQVVEGRRPSGRAEKLWL
jgi:hypothetical protein